MSNGKNAKGSTSSGDGVLIGEDRPLIPPGRYEMVLNHWETYMYFGRAPKLTLWFKIVQFGPHLEAMVARHYHVKAIDGKPRRNGGFRVTFGSDFVREYALVASPGNRLRRFPLKSLHKTVSIGLVDTVTMSARQKDLAPAARYSVIRELIGPAC